MAPVVDQVVSSYPSSTVVCVRRDYSRNCETWRREDAYHPTAVLGQSRLSELCVGPQYGHKVSDSSTAEAMFISDRLSHYRSQKLGRSITFAVVCKIHSIHFSRSSFLTYINT